MFTAALQYKEKPLVEKRTWKMGERRKDAAEKEKEKKDAKEKKMRK